MEDLKQILTTAIRQSGRQNEPLQPIAVAVAYNRDKLEELEARILVLEAAEDLAGRICAPEAAAPGLGAPSETEAPSGDPAEPPADPARLPRAADRTGLAGLPAD